MMTESEVPAAPRAPIAKRAALVLALWLGFWMLALGLVAGLLWIPFAQLAYRSSIELSGGVAGVAGLTLAYALRPRRRDPAGAKVIDPLSRDSAQPLYALVERIGAGLGIVAPVNIHLIGESSAFIYGKRNWFGKVKSLEVALGLPLVGSMSEPELGSVIAHEFGHFVAGDLSLGPWVYRTRNAIARTVTDLDNSLFFLDLLFRTYGQWFLRLSASVSRAQEYAADAAAARAFGAVATSNALKKVHLLHPVWSSYFDLDLVPALNRGARVPIFEGFRRFCKATNRRADVQEAIRRAELRTASEYDTHPALEARVAALMPDAMLSYPPLADCFALLGGEAATEQAWYCLFPREDVVDCGWPRFGQDVLQAQIAARFSGSWMDPARLPLSELVPMAKQLDELWPRMRPDGVSFLSRQGKRNHTTGILNEWIIACLVKRGFTATVNPGQALSMGRDGTAVEPDALLGAALAETLTVEYLAQFELAD
jgi:Zn-dependent protease with chaperone function